MQGRSASLGVVQPPRSERRKPRLEPPPSAHPTPCRHAKQYKKKQREDGPQLWWSGPFAAPGWTRAGRLCFWSLSAPPLHKDGGGGGGGGARARVCVCVCGRWRRRSAASPQRQHCAPPSQARPGPGPRGQQAQAASKQSGAQRTLCFELGLQARVLLALLFQVLSQCHRLPLHLGKLGFCVAKRPARKRFQWWVQNRTRPRPRAHAKQPGRGAARRLTMAKQRCFVRGLQGLELVARVPRCRGKRGEPLQDGRALRVAHPCLRGAAGKAPARRATSAASRRCASRSNGARGHTTRARHASWKTTT